MAKVPLKTTHGRAEVGIGRTEGKRRIWHLMPGFLPFLLWPIPHKDPASPELVAVVVGINLALAAAIYVRYRDIARAGDRGRFPAVIGYIGSIIVTLVLFPAHVELALTVLAILAFGDGCATAGGLYFGGPRLPWNSQKSWAGTLTFLTIGTAMASIVYWGEANNLEAQGTPPGFATSLAVAGTATLVAAIAESLPSRIDDNIRVGVAAAVTVVVAHAMIVGL